MPMSPDSADTRPNIFPGIKYQDAPGIIDWLVLTFGFEKQFIVPGPNGTIAHAQLKYGPGVIMVGSARDRDELFGSKTPREAGGVTQSVYIYVADIDSHFARARSAGAEIIVPLKDTEYGSREYSARDPEGHVWSFGTYYPEGPSSEPSHT